MLRDLRRFYREAPALARTMPPDVTLGAFLDANGYGQAFQHDHLLPMAAAIWSASAESLRAYPALHFIRFCDNHGLLKFTDRPVWRTVEGGSREYVRRMADDIQERCYGRAVRSIRRDGGSVTIRTDDGSERRFDHAVLACHADQALALLAHPTAVEDTLLGSFRYTKNRAVLHGDVRLMPKRQAVWASWNYLGSRDHSDQLHVTYWMNRLQGLTGAPPLFLTLNPVAEPAGILHEELYYHPGFDTAAMQAQEGLWSLQGRQRTWFCGAYFGAGFHEDGLQSGLAVAEQLGGVRRPWTVPNDSGRISVTPVPEMAA
jgi:predicted NAD/FAD-binding protein